MSKDQVLRIRKYGVDWGCDAEAIASLTGANVRQIRDVLSGKLIDELLHGGQLSPAPEPIQISVGSDACERAAHELHLDDLRGGGGFRTLRLRLTDETYRFYRALEHAFERLVDLPMSFVRFLCLAIWDNWRPTLDERVAYHRIYARDLHRCQSPVCNRGDVTPHHLTYRSRGGTEEDDNLISLCTWCHLDGIHGGRIRATAPAGNIEWHFGDRAAPTLVVAGRELQPPAQG